MGQGGVLEVAAPEPETKGRTCFQETERWATPGEGAAGPSTANLPGKGLHSYTLQSSRGLRSTLSVGQEVEKQMGSGHRAPMEP